MGGRARRRDREPELPEEPREVLRALARNFVEFSLAGLPRYQLMDQRVIPDFQPSAENYAPAVRLLERVRRIVTRIFGELRDDDLDLFIVMISGLVGSQWSNDPGGTRYVSQLDRVVDLLADELGLPRTTPSGADRRS